MPDTREKPGRYILKSADYQGIRWRQGERLEQLFEERCDALRRSRQDGGGLAVDGPAVRLTYAELDRRANKLARFLIRRRGVRPGDRIGLLFDEAADGYAGMLAVLKARAVYVPLDAGFPQDRLSYIISDASVRMMLTSSGRLMYLACRLSHCGYPNSAARGLPHTRAADPGYRGDRLFGLSVSPLFRLVSLADPLARPD
jgi:non-ribosomal peptide synthetase component F